jgi:hypothetical protein
MPAQQLQLHSAASRKTHKTPEWTAAEAAASLAGPGKIVAARKGIRITGVQHF